MGKGQISIHSLGQSGALPPFTTLATTPQCFTMDTEQVVGQVSPMKRLEPKAMALKRISFYLHHIQIGQIDATPTGSLLSPITASLFMEDLEVKDMQSAPLRRSLWLRYVDDAFVIWPHGEEELQLFHTHLNLGVLQHTVHHQTGERGVWPSLMCC